MKRQTTDWENVFIKCTPGYRPVSRIYELPELSKNKKNIGFTEQTKYLNRHFINKAYTARP